MSNKAGRPIVLQDAVRALISSIGEDPSREGLRDTPGRYIKAWGEWGFGYGLDAASVLKTFEDGAEGCGNEIVLVANIPVYSMCEHHMAPIWGNAHIGYIPDGRVLGLSKFARLTNILARRLQVQERLTNQIADTLHTGLVPKAIGVILECRHMCMESRGVNVRGAITTTSALRGKMMTEPALRAEFLQLVTNASSTRNGL